jgi:hypothetical protein
LGLLQWSTRCDNKVRELATVRLTCQQWTVCGLPKSVLCDFIYVSSLRWSICDSDMARRQDPDAGDDDVQIRTVATNEQSRTVDSGRPCRL